MVKTGSLIQHFLSFPLKLPSILGPYYCFPKYTQDAWLLSGVCLFDPSLKITQTLQHLNVILGPIAIWHQKQEKLAIPATKKSNWLLTKIEMVVWGAEASVMISRLASFVISNDICNVINTGLCHHCISGMLSVTHFSRALQTLLMEQMLNKLDSCLRSSKYFSTDLSQIIYAKWCNLEETNTYFDKH